MTIALVGEAWGEEEARTGRPFVGPSGRILNSMLHVAGIARHECLVTNVFNLRPKPSNDIVNLCGPREEAISGMPAVQRGKYIHRVYAAELERLYRELKVARPNVVVALGATAAWALLQTSGIKGIRGSVQLSERLGVKVLPTYHPAAVMREWELRPIVIADLFKAKAQAAFPELRLPRRQVFIEPTLSDLDWFEREHISRSEWLSVDIETAGDQITCIGFAPTTEVAMVVPFFNWSAEDGNYWREPEDEVEAWMWVKRICESDKKMVGQNHLYDINFLWSRYGIKMRSAHDTMLLHHALQVEMEKSLGFLGSVYTNEAPWKLMRNKSTAKREDS